MKITQKKLRSYRSFLRYQKNTIAYNRSKGLQLWFSASDPQSVKKDKNGRVIKLCDLSYIKRFP